LTSKVLGSGVVLLTRELPFARPLPTRAPTVYPLASRHGVFSARVGVPESEMPDGNNPPGI
jgi:hypothetical protein